MGTMKLPAIAVMLFGILQQASAANISLTTWLNIMPPVQCGEGMNVYPGRVWARSNTCLVGAFEKLPDSTKPPLVRNYTMFYNASSCAEGGMLQYFYTTSDGGKGLPKQIHAAPDCSGKPTFEVFISNGGNFARGKGFCEPKPHWCLTDFPSPRESSQCTCVD